MKKIVFTLIAIGMFYVGFAQGINFQGVARSANGTIIAGSNVSLRLSIISKNVDATPEFVALSQSLHPQLKGKVLQATLPNFSPPFGGEFDSVLCSAVLMHVTEKELEPSAVSIKRCLKKSGRLLYSVPSKRLDVVTDNRDTNGRLFIPDQSDRLQIIFERLGFSLISKWGDADSMGRDSVEWVSVLMELSNV